MIIKIHSKLFLLVFIVLAACTIEQPLLETKETVVPEPDNLDVFEPKAREYLLSQLGSQFEQDLTSFHKRSGTFTFNGGCDMLMMPEKGGKKYLYSYFLDLSRYISYDYPLKNITSSGRYAAFWIPAVEPKIQLTIVLDENGEVYCTGDVVDCVNHPDFCPPFAINNMSKAVAAFKNLYPQREVNAVQLSVYTPGDDFLASPLFPKLSKDELRFLWEFGDVRCGHKVCTSSFKAYLDPNTKKEVPLNHFE